MRILALDTATEAASAALLTEAGLSCLCEPGRNRHSERLFPMCRELLEAAGLQRSDIDCVAFGAGPGAFTGLRVACGAAQGLAWALGKPVACVSNLMALALAARDAGAGGRVLAMLDARMHECYCAAYDLGEGLPGLAAGPELVKPAGCGELARGCGAACAAGSALAAYGPEMGLPGGLLLLPEAAPTAAHIARLALLMARAGQTVDAAHAAPVYVRNRVALTAAERAAGER
ncbi:MAG: tRNA (adenosine(37)-N6)-threonylcarbamoyltransferase complex dimerization subunit type 1 TsaB, partial [Duodenibacillus sp.]|nr:tRNA (adenosine(37)-N6)-threonylcarbamoyltransferase complex dimerization subunit type 1 TsaB [Duodenibacillus sp.]